MTGKQFAHYVVLGQAGAGAMGVVYRARDEKLQRDVALKLPAEGAVLTAEVRAKWLAEARAASALNHPNICTIYEVGECEGQPYIAMEYLAGAPLNERIPDGGLSGNSSGIWGADGERAGARAHKWGAAPGLEVGKCAADRQRAIESAGFRVGDQFEGKRARGGERIRMRGSPARRRER